MYFEGAAQISETLPSKHLEIEIIGNPRPETVAAIKGGIAQTFEQMGYKGDEMPVVHLLEGKNVDDEGKELPSAYYIRRRYSSDGRGHIFLSEKGMENHLSESKLTEYSSPVRGRLISPRAIATLSSSHETVHFVQDLRDQIGIHEASIEGTPEYNMLPWEIEAWNVSMKVLFKELGLSSLILSDTEGKLKLLGWFVKEIVTVPIKFFTRKK
ncbi:MAG: hypothetical protein UW42_C0044G0001 [Candidatus Collierbacteria bacterium GW2011_GWB1_44_197]|nr:MAG: hypothetical protein UW42_C0044G0001 [Candidatus Collierbacteria bacterium GW2011_GWB1_44_197]